MPSQSTGRDGCNRMHHFTFFQLHGCRNLALSMTLSPSWVRREKLGALEKKLKVYQSIDASKTDEKVKTGEWQGHGRKRAQQQQRGVRNTPGPWVVLLFVACRPLS